MFTITVTYKRKEVLNYYASLMPMSYIGSVQNRSNDQESMFIIIVLLQQLNTINCISGWKPDILYNIEDNHTKVEIKTDI